MKAAVSYRYGPPDVVQVTDVPRPTPAEDQLLVRVHATTVNRTECGFRGSSATTTSASGGGALVPHDRPGRGSVDAADRVGLGDHGACDGGFRYRVTAELLLTEQPGLRDWVVCSESDACLGCRGWLGDLVCRVLMNRSAPHARVAPVLAASDVLATVAWYTEVFRENRLLNSSSPRGGPGGECRAQTGHIK